MSETVSPQNPLAKWAAERRARAAAAAAAMPPGTVVDVVTVKPATGLRFAYESSAGDARPMRLEASLVYADDDQPHNILGFSVGLYDNPVVELFPLSPIDDMSAEAAISIEGGVSGDSFICHRLGDVDEELKVVLTVSRLYPDGSGGQIIREVIRDADEHRFVIP